MGEVAKLQPVSQSQHVAESCWGNRETLKLAVCKKIMFRASVLLTPFVPDSLSPSLSLFSERGIVPIVFQSKENRPAGRLQSTRSLNPGKATTQCETAVLACLAVPLVTWSTCWRSRWLNEILIIFTISTLFFFGHVTTLQTRTHEHKTRIMSTPAVSSAPGIKTQAAGQDGALE